MKTIILLCCIAVSGCSVWMTNKGSPIRLENCHIWAPVVDTTFAAGMGAAAIVANRSKHISEESKTAYMVGSIMMATAFSVAALMGYGDYYKCEE